MRITCKEVLEATKGKLIAGDVNTLFEGVSINSQGSCKGCLFVPIIGDKYDAHEFIQGSINAGAVGILTQKDVDCSNDVSYVIIKVQDTTEALHRIAEYYRQQYQIPIVGITGSVGKTTTKDIIAAILEEKYCVLKTEGNFNNQIGVPLTLLKLESKHDVGVIEMGMRGEGQIRLLSNMVHPKISLITNIGISHIELLGSRQNILNAKMEIFEGMTSGGVIILNGDDPMLNDLKVSSKIPIIFYGTKGKVHYKAEDITPLGERGVSFTIKLNKEKYDVRVPVPGVHNVYTALAGIAVGMELGVSVEQILTGISKYVPYEMRTNIIQKNGIKIINDCYNASPDSVHAAIEVLVQVGINNRKIAVLGSMLELGKYASESHMKVGELIAHKNIKYLVTVGELAKDIAVGALQHGMLVEDIHSCHTNADAVEFLRENIEAGDVILVKGSRSMNMEEVVRGL